MTKDEINQVQKTKDSSCSCNLCQSACRYKPGWFLPDEIENVATFLELSIQETFKTKLGIDWWVGEVDPIFLLSPALKLGETGTEFPADPRGECIFYKDEQCEIYPVRPFECRKFLHGMPKKKTDIRHEVVSLAWIDSQEWIANLLGREPEAKAFGFLDIINSPYY